MFLEGKFETYKNRRKILKQEKKENYKPYAAFHTLSGVSTTLVDGIDNTVERCVKACSQKKKRNRNELETYLELNPNKYYNNFELIKTYSDFKNVMEKIMVGTGIKLDDFEIRRADFSFNSENPEDYILYQKLHRLLILCLAYTYSFKNCYQTNDLWSWDSLNIAIKNDTMAVENYDKNAESQGTSLIKNRLEERSFRMEDSNLEYQFTKIWFNRWDNAIKNFIQVQKKCNDYLEKLYKDDLQKPKRQRRYLSLTAFLMQYSDSIFCNKQLVDLLSRFDEVPNPSNRAKNFKRNHAIEYYSMSDLRHVVGKIKKATLKYFNS